MKHSFVIPHINKNDLLERCLMQFREHNGNEPEIIIVDDCSNPENFSVTVTLAKKYNALVIQNTVNSGFSKTVNRGIEKANGDIITLMNNDLFCTQEITTEIEDTFKRDSKIGIVGALLFYDNSDRIQHGGIIRKNNTTLQHDGVGQRLCNVPHVLESKYIIAVTGALFSIRREMIDDIGMLGEQFFLAFEDTEYCLRAWANGWRIFYNPKIQAIHAEGATRGNTIETKRNAGNNWFEKELQGMPKFFEIMKRFNFNLVDKAIKQLNEKKKINKTSKVIVVKRMIALGDVFFTTGIIRELKKRNPNYDIVVVTKKPEIFINNPNVAYTVSTMEEISNYSKLYDLDNTYEKHPEMSAIDCYGMIVFGTDSFGMDLSPEIHITQNDKINAMRMAGITTNFKKAAVISLPNSWPVRTIPIKTWDKIIKALPEFKFFAVGSKYDLPPPQFAYCKNLQGKLTIQEIYALIQQCAFYIGPDSGITNIANATDTECINIFTCVNPFKRLWNVTEKTHNLTPLDNCCSGCLSQRYQDTRLNFTCSMGTDECIKNINYDDIIRIMKGI